MNFILIGIESSSDKGATKNSKIVSSMLIEK